MTICIVANCSREATNNFSERLRREDTSAIWAPNTEAYLCDAHAEMGFVIDVQLTPIDEKRIKTNVCAGGEVKTRITDIINRP